MTTALPEVVRLPADPSLIQLSYHHEHPVRSYEFDDTLEVWRVNVRIDVDVLAEDMAALAGPRRRPGTGPPWTLLRRQGAALLLIRNGLGSGSLEGCERSGGGRAASVAVGAG
ncbi:hypothetical protein ACFWC9_39605, partial [Streptomyces goshikiensis]|uniref:hypothetical protein n=1 Tax=Streptomyces goshikiensis TaxID=1942 RepID=UPI0036D201B6